MQPLMAYLGYAKSAEDSHRLVIDEYAAGIVRRIFDMRLSGTAYSRIVASLNRENIPSPRLRKWSISVLSPSLSRQSSTETKRHPRLGKTMSVLFS